MEGDGEQDNVRCAMDCINDEENNEVIKRAILCNGVNVKGVGEKKEGIEGEDRMTRKCEIKE